VSIYSEATSLIPEPYSPSLSCAGPWRQEGPVSSSRVVGYHAEVAEGGHPVFYLWVQPARVGGGLASWRNFCLDLYQDESAAVQSTAFPAETLLPTCTPGSSLSGSMEAAGTIFSNLCLGSLGQDPEAPTGSGWPCSAQLRATWDLVQGTWGPHSKEQPQS
jgi:hypothetical protein